MTFSYKLKEGLPDERDQVRLLVSDVDPTNFLMHDEEIDFFLSQEPNIYWTAAAVANSMIVRLDAAFFEDQKVGETRLRSKRINELKLLVAQWRARGGPYNAGQVHKRRARGSAHQLPSAGGIFVADQEASDQNEGLLHNDFFRGMDDYPGTTRKSKPKVGRRDGFA